MYRRCLSLLHEPGAARDATRDVFVKLLRHMKRFEKPESALGWTYRVATMHCSHVLRAAKTVQPGSVGE